MCSKTSFTLTVRKYLISITDELRNGNMCVFRRQLPKESAQKAESGCPLDRLTRSELQQGKELAVLL